MHATFISECALKGLARTRHVLDGYAHRVGERTWMTPITWDGLEAVRSQLRQVATRHMAVSCFINDGRDQAKHLWTVGHRGVFGDKGRVVVNTTTARAFSQSGAVLPTDLPRGLRMASLLASAAGYAHDFGKAFQLFQLKLRDLGPRKDAVRHEWISHQVLLQGILESDDPKASWARATQIPSVIRLDQESFRLGLDGPMAALSYLVYTHHRMPGDVGDSEGTELLSEKTYVSEDWPSHARHLVPMGQIDRSVIESVRKNFNRLTALSSDPLQPVPREPDTSSSQPDTALRWRAIASVARVALILADHSVSSLVLPAPKEKTEGVLYANTTREEDGSRRLNQTLNWHLHEVGGLAGRILAKMHGFRPEGLSDTVRQALRSTAERSLTEPSLARFQWQAKSAHSLSLAQQCERLPTLVFNIAGTGCGKTRGNVLIADALRRGESLRLATGLNLRTLTLQTRDAYANQLGIRGGELACILGSAAATLLHEAKVAAVQELNKGPAKTSSTEGFGAIASEDEDGNEFEPEFEAIGESDVAPPWLDAFLQKNPKMKALITTPVVVCTMDFLVAAGDPTRQGNHGLTMLRLMSSDLILDEIDSYDPKGLVAVTRVVTAAAMWGRNVIASSATLSRPVAKALWEAFDLGLRMGHALEVLSSAKGRQALVDDAHDADLQSLDSVESFVAWYQDAIAMRCASMGKRSLRPCELIEWDRSDGEGTGGSSNQIQRAHEAIARACLTMHDRHRWSVVLGAHEHKVSFGLVRIANITQAVATAKALSLALPQARVACYHAQLPRMQRHLMEFVLDGVLQRSDVTLSDADRLSRYPEVIDAIRSDRSQGLNETVFIVVATPVEEVGRDHDFDWGVLEPSSTQSLVQTAGRINRHRLRELDSPNVAIMRWNFANMFGRSRCFTRPGLESEEAPFGTQDLADIINWPSLREAGQIDARLRYEGEVHPFASYDDGASAMQINRASKRFLKSSSALWMGAYTYQRVRLREASDKEVWTRLAEHYHVQERTGPSPRDLRWRRTGNLVIENGPSRAWLSWSDEHMFNESRKAGLHDMEALLVEVRPATEQRDLVHNLAYGFHLR